MSRHGDKRLPGYKWAKKSRATRWISRPATRAQKRKAAAVRADILFNARPNSGILFPDHPLS